MSEYLDLITMSASLPPFKSFLSGSNLTTFWNMVKWILFLVAPVVLIFFATDIIGGIVRMIRKSVGDEAMKDDKDDDDDYEYYRY